MGQVVQRNGVRLVAFQKCGHTSLINTFVTPPTFTVERGARHLEAKHGDSKTVGDWPVPVVTVAFFRNPLARTWSVYNHLVRDNFRDEFSCLGIDQSSPFDQFCEAIVSCDDLSFDNHLKPQVQSFREAAKGSYWVARLEEAEWKWPRMCRVFQLDCTTKLARFNIADYSHPWTRAYHRMDRKLLNALLACYAGDNDVWEEQCF